jgi:hypothetical protein
MNITRVPGRVEESHWYEEIISPEVSSFKWKPELAI